MNLDVIDKSRSDAGVKGQLSLRRKSAADERPEPEKARQCRCPYCKQTKEWTGNKCPCCGRSARPPDYYTKKISKPSDRREERARRRREIYSSSGAGGVWSSFVAKTPLMRWLLLAGGLAVIGAMIQAPRMPKDLSGSIKTAKYNISMLGIALDNFRDDCGRYPTTAEGLASLIHNPGLEGWHGPYIRKLKPDPWRRPFGYTSDGERIEKLYTKGPDGIEGTKDDVTAADVEAEEKLKKPTAEDTPVNVFDHRNQPSLPSPQAEPEAETEAQEDGKTPE